MIVGRPKAQEAAEVLGLKLEDVTELSLKRAYRDRAKECHPDKIGGTEKIQEWSRVSWANECLTHWLKHHPPSVASETHNTDIAIIGDCRVCKGSGRVKVGTGFSKLTVQCVNCRGEGTITPMEVDSD